MTAAQPNRRRGPVLPVAAFRALWLDPALSVAAIGRRLGITRQAVRWRALAYGLPAERPAPLRIADAELLRALWSARVPQAQIARHFGVDRTTVAAEARRLGLPHRPRGRGARPVALAVALMARSAAAEGAACAARWAA
ncbi:MAG TPA: hypothetical protein PKE47_01925 [Verrucomicrobiota bacterium]|nr:hypothetical protein [Verrucomicrobiota bacterium]